MGIRHKTYNFRLYPTEKQKSLLSHHFGCGRFVYNYFLEKRKSAYEKDGLTLSYIDTCNELVKLKKTEDHKWLSDVGHAAMQASLKDLNSAYTNFFKKNADYPKFKAKYRNRQSFRMPTYVSIKDDCLKIIKFREGIKIHKDKKWGSKEKNIKKICFATIVKEPSGKYFASVTCEVEHTPYDKAIHKVGIDTGIKDLAILSTGTTYGNIKPLRTHRDKLKYEQRQLSRKVKGSKSKDKQRIKVAKTHEKITNVRKNWLHNVSTEIVKNHAIICVEDLSIKNLMKNHKLAQAFADVSLGNFYIMLQYKAEWNNREFVKIGRFYPSSKKCSNCGWIKKDLTLKDRTWICPDCITEHDRDFNASLNILQEGLRILSGSGNESDVNQKQVKALSLDRSMTPEMQQS